MRRAFCLIGCVLAAATAAPPAHAWIRIGAGGMPEARWCIVRSGGIAQVQWDCRYRTLAICAAAVSFRSDMCLENPNWNLPGYYRR